MSTGFISATNSHRISEAVAAIRKKIGDHAPRAAIVLGSGLGGLAGTIQQPRSIAYDDIPHFARSTASGHRGAIVAGFFGHEKSVPVVAMAGRLHCYEGWTVEQVTFPVRVLAALGVKVLILSNAAGGLNPNYRVGDMMVIRDHINFMHRRRTAADDGNGMESTNGRTLHGPYDPTLSAVALRAARRGDFVAWEGTYLATLGPSYETRAEYRMMRRIGADAVGMSTVPEVIAAARQGMRVLAISMISNVARPDVGVKTSHQQVLAAGQQAEPRMGQMVEAVVATV